jgi:hypothetical protein
MFTVFSTWTMKTIFFGFLIIVFLVALIFKNIHVRASLLIIFSSCYGIILAKWYQVHPLEGRFGDNGFLDSLGIVLSAILLIIPVLRITQKIKFLKNNAGLLPSPVVLYCATGGGKFYGYYQRAMVRQRRSV